MNNDKFDFSKERVLLLEKGRRGFSKMIFGRTGIIVLLLLFQAVILVTGFIYIEDVFPYMVALSVTMSVVIVINLISNDDNPVVKITWIVLIMLMPVFGLLLYLFIKMDLGHRLMIGAYNNIINETKPLMHSEKAVNIEECDASDDFKSTGSYLNGLGFPVYTNTEVKYFPLGEDKFEEMLVQLEAAEKFIFLEYFIVAEGYMWGRVLDILHRKVQQGVEVRMMYDGTCAFALLPYNYPKKINDLGIKCKMFSPITPFISTHYNNRDHRKILVIDGKVAFTGGINLADEYINQKEVYGHWKDTAIMLRGDAVRTFTLMFLQMWNTGVQNKENYAKYLLQNQQYHYSGYVIPYGDSPLDKDLTGEMVYYDMINRANKYVHIMTPYLIIDNEMITALIFAAKRGIDVRLILPHIPDKKIPFALAHGHYKRLIENGVKIYEYEPGFIHAKVFVCDDIKAVVGTINLDYRSLYHHFECAAYLYDVPVIADIEKDFIKTQNKSIHMTLELLKKDKLIMKATSELLRILAPLM